MNTLLMQQLSAVKSSMGAVNNTLADVEYNENLLKEGISRVTKYMDTLTHCGRVTQICVFNTVKLGTSASSP